MAITVFQAPTFGASLHYPLYHYVSSTNVGNADFRYVFDIYVAGVLVMRAKVLPDDGRGLFDASAVVRAFRGGYFRPRVTTPPLVLDTDDIYVEYTVGYGEEYTVSGITTTYTNLTTGTYRAYNAYNKMFPVDSPERPLENYGYRWLTERSTYFIDLPATGKGFISFLNAATPYDDWRMQVEPLDANYVPTGVSSTSTFSVSTETQLLVFDLSIASVSAAAGITPLAADVPGYRMRLTRTGPVNTAWVYVRFFCEPRMKAEPLHFLNRLGGFDTFYFRNVSRTEITTEKKTLRRIPQVQAFNLIREYNPTNNVFADGPVTYATQSTGTIKLESGYLNDTDYDWLQQLIASPQVYYQRGGYYYPVTVKTESWQQKYTAIDKVYTLELEISLGRQVQSQYR